MKAGFDLAWRHLRFNAGRSAIVVACLTLVMVLPVTVNELVDRYEAHLLNRGDSTPLLIGARGDRFDLVLKTLYFDPEYQSTILSSDAEALRDAALGIVVPLYIRHRVLAPAAEIGAIDPSDAPLVGTDLEYFELRGLRAATGHLPVFLGDLVVGAEAARALDVAVGDRLLTKPERAYDPSGSFQLGMPVVGVLSPTGTADDHAVFGAVRTVWVIDGIGHGHEAVKDSSDPSLTMPGTGASNVLVATPKVARYQEITPDNRASYHFHGSTDAYPLTALILVPEGARERALALGLFQANETRVLLEPGRVIREILGLVLQVKRLFDANMLVVGLSTALFMMLVMVLSARLRRDEMSTLVRLGCARGTLFWVQAWELVLLVTLSVAAATISGAGLTWLVANSAWVPF